MSYQPITDVEAEKAYGIIDNLCLGPALVDYEQARRGRELLPQLRADREHWKQVAGNGIECLACLKKTPAEPVCLYCAGCYGDLAGEVERLWGEERVLAYHNHKQAATIARLREEVERLNRIVGHYQNIVEEFPTKPKNQPC